MNIRLVRAIDNLETIAQTFVATNVRQLIVTRANGDVETWTCEWHDGTWQSALKSMVKS